MTGNISRLGPPEVAHPSEPDSTRPIREFPDPPLSLRSRLSRVRAQLAALLGQGGGFFTQYAYVGHVRAVAGDYPEVAQLCAASEFRLLLDEMRDLVPTCRFFGEAGATDPVLGRGMFPVLDGLAAYAAVRRFRPKRVVEIGSGDSTYFLARAVADNGVGSVTCIDPQPRREIVALNVDLKRRMLSEEDAELAARLEPNDILFIDSSHIMLPGMDVDIQFNRMFPRLKPGVIVHVHDVFLPDNYPATWRTRNYSEQNALIGWLVSGYFDILWPGRYLATRHPEMLAQALRGVDLGSGAAGSMWLRRAGG